MVSGSSLKLDVVFESGPLAGALRAKATIGVR